MCSKEEALQQLCDYGRDAYRLLLFTQKLPLLVYLVLRYIPASGDFYNTLKRQQLEPKYVWLKGRIISIIEKEPFNNYLTILDKERRKLFTSNFNPSFHWIEHFGISLSIDPMQYDSYWQQAKWYQEYGVGPEQDITAEDLIAEPYRWLGIYARQCFESGVLEFGWSSEYELDENELRELKLIDEILIEAHKSSVTNANRDVANDNNEEAKIALSKELQARTMIKAEESHPIDEFFDFRFREFLNSELTDLIDTKVKTYWNELKLAYINKMPNTTAILSFSIIDALLRIGLLAKYPHGKGSKQAENSDKTYSILNVSSEYLLDRAEDEGIYPEKHAKLVEFAQASRNSVHLHLDRELCSRNDAEIIYALLKEICDRVKEFIREQARAE
ncbi:MAG: hypothetical protein RML35_11930 [Chloroherpetonaceae bacterium]|nr:hypothetical protein [Gloeomargarita sp. SKYG116]MCS7226781.1 hypothetical protein [Gloeomargarita sp. SKYB31]MDW8402334.1 hypothetical protein [Gloeomargarita sp. SKYGB_i_bin116]MDW8466842.1 hypothetical protein [Chloroherpetonaceae bacterium]